jgi:rhamnosyltransferase subunit B
MCGSLTAVSSGNFHKMRVFLCPFGSAGDVFPFIWLARRLAAAGHQPLLVTSSPFAAAAAGAGIDFEPVGRDEEFEVMLRDPRLWRPFVGTKLVFDLASGLAGPFADIILGAAGRHGRPDLLISPMTAFGARVVREKIGVPLVTVHLQPVAILSAYDTPIVVPALAPLLRVLPRRLKSLMFRHGPNPVDWFCGKPLRALCARHGVRPPRSFWRQWWDSPDGTLALFPHWFAAPQPDWPQRLLQWNFPLEDLAADQTLSGPLAAFLERHSERKPVAFTAGSANLHASVFFQVALETLRRLDRPGVLLSRDRAQLPADLPDSVIHCEYAPFSQLLGQCAAFVHHGGVGTLSQGFAAGLPQLVTALAHDQPDNGARLRLLRAGDVMPVSSFRAATAAPVLSRLLDDPAIADSCRRIKARLEIRPDAAPLIQWLEGAAARGAGAIASRMPRFEERSSG